MTQALKWIIGASAALVFVGISSVSFAAGSSSDEPKKKVTTPVELKCKKNQVVKTKLRDGKKVTYCAVIKTGVLDDDELYDQGRALAQAGHYDWAIDVLAAVQNQDDPRVLNYIGYSHRKAGRLETGFAFYKRALEINPNFVLAREYLGEGYVAAGRIDLAQVELNEIEKRCGVQCTEYTELSKVITTALN